MVEGIYESGGLYIRWVYFPVEMKGIGISDRAGTIKIVLCGIYVNCFVDLIN